MPFRALRHGNVVVPAVVPNREPVSCPECGNTMYACGGESVARHFRHDSDSYRESCPSTSIGESSTHARCVALAVVALQETFNSQAARCAAEVEIDVSKSGSGNRTRRADALVEFAEKNQFFGKGLVIEVQHKNHKKDTEIATHDYLSIGYSVAWLSSEDFGEEQLDYSVVNEAFISENGAGFSARNYSPKQFINCENYYYSSEHNWGIVPGYVLTCEEDYEICIGRGCTLRRKYDNESSEYVYNPMSVTTPDLPLKVLENTLVSHSGRDIKKLLIERYHEAVLEKALADRPEIDKCSGPKGFHEWGPPESLWDGYAKVELRACQHCPAHLLSDLRGRIEDRNDILFSKEPDPEWNLLSLEADPWKCQHQHNEVGHWYEYCTDCGVSSPSKY